MFEQVIQGLKGCITVWNKSPIKIDEPKELTKLALSCGERNFPNGLDSVGRFHWCQRKGQGSQELVFQGHSWQH